jgi:hypothetical protein
LIKLICLDFDLDIDININIDLDLCINIDLAPAVTLLAVENLPIGIVQTSARRDFSCPASQRDTTVDGKSMLPTRARIVTMNNYHM